MGRVLAMMLAIVLLAACGKKGDLYLPAQTAAPTPAAPAHGATPARAG